MLARAFAPVLVVAAALAAGTATLFALAGQSLVELNPVDGKVVREIASPEGRPTVLAVGPDGMF